MKPPELQWGLTLNYKLTFMGTFYKITVSSNRSNKKFCNSFVIYVEGLTVNAQNGVE